MLVWLVNLDYHAAEFASTGSVFAKDRLQDVWEYGLWHVVSGAVARATRDAALAEDNA